MIHDRDRIYCKDLDESLKTLGLTALKTPYRSPQANSFCERLIGTARRECLDFIIPLNEAHVRRTLKLWAEHYNRGRPHSSLGPGIRTRTHRKQNFSLNGIAFQKTAALWRDRFLQACIMNTG